MPPYDASTDRAPRRESRHAVLLALADDYGDATAGPSFEYETFLPVLRRFFDRVTLWPIDRLLRANGYFQMNSDLVSWVRSEEPEFLFCVPFENQIDWRLLGELRGSSTTTVAWMCDDHWRFEPFSRHIAPHFDFVATTDRTAYVRYLGLPGVRPILTQWGYDPDRFRPTDEARIHAVSFVGARRPHRERHIAALRQAGVSVHVRGRGWPEGRASTRELSTVPARSLISLNFADSTVRHRAGRTQLKARPFELAGTGTCVVTEFDPQLPSYFDVGEQMAVFQTPAECVRVVRALLDDPEQARRIGRSGRQRAEQEHTYESRMSRLLAAANIRGMQRSSDGAACVMN